MKVIGIDPGKDGAMAKVDGTKLLKVETFPKIGSKKDEEINFRELYGRLQIWSRDADLIVVERVHAIFGSSAKSTFNFGRNFQMAVDAASLMIAPLELVKPKEWQKQIFAGETPRFKISKEGARNIKDTKGTSLLVSSRLFPGEKFLKTERSSVPHDGMIDAALIAYWGANFRGRK